MKKYVLALDQGTTSSRAIVFDETGSIVATSQQEFTQYFPDDGWVEHDPIEIFESQRDVAQRAISKAGLSYTSISAIGITNQRETSVVWDKNTGLPIYNAIVWQCRRTAHICEDLYKSGYADLFKEKTGLIIDAYFSATKISWILDNVPGARRKAENGDLLFGTVETWLIWKLTGGKVHITDYSNASRTMLFNIHELKWDKEILSILNIPESLLPEVRPSSENYGTTMPEIFGGGIPICAAIGDQQASLFGQACFTPGMAKNTYGTGCFLLANIGDSPMLSKNGLLTTIAWGIDGKITYALEGSVFVGGAAVQWLRDEMEFFEKASDSERFAKKVKDSNGVYVVPAFVGLGAPHWDPFARGTIVGLTRGANKYHITRATLESIAFQSYDMIQTMKLDIGNDIKMLRADGGATENDFLMQFQADILGAPVRNAFVTETTALGAAYLAGLNVGVWSGLSELTEHRNYKKEFLPKMPEKKRIQLLAGWEEAVKRSFDWAK